MITQNLFEQKKVLVSFLGGTAGDMFTVSMNGKKIYEQPETFDFNRSTIKSLKFNSILELNRSVNKNSTKFISTHDIRSAIKSDFHNINIIVSDKNVQELCILRQMYHQALKIKVESDSSWFNVVSTYCKNKKFLKAANFWFGSARKLWLDEMAYRTTITKNLLDFSAIFNPEKFIDSLKEQGLNYNLDILMYNYQKWLLKNNEYNFNKKNTIESMAYKLSKMNFNKIQGIVEYEPK